MGKQEKRKSWEAYTQEQREEIMQQIFWWIAEDLRSLRWCLRQPGMPDAHTFYYWLDKMENSSWAQQYARSIELRAEGMADDILDIADNAQGDVITLSDGREVTNHEKINRDRLRVDSRKWIMSKLYPRKYGDKVDVTSGGKPIAEKVSVEFKDYSE